MTLRKAYEILGCSSDEDEKQIKKKYRRLMHQVHPDANVKEIKYKYSVQEINEAYDMICKNQYAKFDLDMDRPVKKSTKKKKPEVKKWDAPINEHAYTSRKVFHYVEDYDGSNIGSFCIAEGKYMWKPEEDFPLFLKSIYECSKELVGGNETVAQIEAQAKIAFLLSQQFIDGYDTLTRFTTGEEDNVFFVPSMLEITCDSKKIRTGMTLYPKKLSNHRLYIMNGNKEEVGYLSFKDDRLYYAIIPLMEQKRAQVKMIVSQVQDKSNTRGQQSPNRRTSQGEGKYKNLDFWIKIIENDGINAIENLNLEIENILNKLVR